MRLRTILLTACAMLLTLIAGSITTMLTAQEASTSAVDDEASAAADANESHRRLPPYFSDLVTPGQRTKIYSIQDRYEAQIEELKEQLRKVVAQRDAEVEAVLEPEQRELLTSIKQQSQRLREARAKAAAKLKEKLPEDATGASVGN